MRYLISTLLAMMAFSISGTASIAAQEQDKAPRAIKREIIPGSELMTPAEREQYRQRIRGARSSAEEDSIRTEHRKRMQERARLRGLRLAEPAASGEKK